MHPLVAGGCYVADATCSWHAAGRTFQKALSRTACLLQATDAKPVVEQRRAALDHSLNLTPE